MSENRNVSPNPAKPLDRMEGRMSDRDPLFDRLDDAIDFLIETGNGSAQDDLPDWATDEGVQLLIDARERIRAVPAIVPLSPGERPTEPGWYVVRYNGALKVVEANHPGADGKLRIFETGYLAACDIEDYTFIASIYPDRIEGREG